VKLIKYLSEVKMCSAEVIEENEPYVLVKYRIFFS